MTEIKAVIFDLDDTLVSEKKYIESGYLHVAKLLTKKLGKEKEQIYQLLIALFRKSPKNVFNRLFEELNLDYTNDTIKDLVCAYRNHPPEIAFFDDVLPCLDMMKKKKIKTGIITDGYASAQRQKLNALKASCYFDEIIVTDELGEKGEYWKPHPLAFSLMKEKLGVEFDEMCYIGDNPEKDFYISFIYPIKTIKIERNGVHANKNYLHDIRENYSIHHLNEIFSLIAH